jgi:integrase
MYNKLIKWGLYDGKNPCAGLSKYKETKRKRFLRGDEMPGFFVALNALPESDFKDFVGLLLYLAARRNNVLGMRWAHVDLRTGLWTYPTS